MKKFKFALVAFGVTKCMTVLLGCVFGPLEYIQTVNVAFNNT